MKTIALILFPLSIIASIICVGLFMGREWGYKVLKWVFSK